MMRKLYSTTSATHKLIKEVYAGHNDAYVVDEYPQLIYQFIQSVRWILLHKLSNYYSNFKPFKHF